MSDERPDRRRVERGGTFEIGEDVELVKSSTRTAEPDTEPDDRRLLSGELRAWLRLRRQDVEPPEGGFRDGA